MAVIKATSPGDIKLVVGNIGVPVKIWDTCLSKRWEIKDEDDTGSRNRHPVTGRFVITGEAAVAWEWLTNDQKLDLVKIMDIGVHFKVIKSGYGQHECTLSGINNMKNGVVYRYEALSGSEYLCP
jgi:hypothetical protein